MDTNNSESGKNLADFSAQITGAVETASASIVAIDARPRVATSGIIWRESGVIVSTNHTIRRDEQITVSLADGQTASASVVGRDPGTDLAVLKINDEEIARTLQPAQIIETSHAKTGNIVLAIGRTGAEIAASFGIVNRVSGAWRTWRGDEIERLLGLDLSIFLGFSGGALIDADGKVLGVNTSAFGRGMALTIPSKTVNRIVDVLLSKGKISKPYLGIGTQTVLITENLRGKLNLEQTNGLMMLTVEAGGAAEKAGVLIGDILLSIDGSLTHDPADVQSALRDKEAGETVTAKILRGGEITEIEIVLGSRPEQQDGERRGGRGGHGGRGWRHRGGGRGWR